MGTTNTGNQIINFRFEDQIRAVEVNQLLRTIIPAGVYEGGTLSQNVNDVTLSPFTMVIDTDYSDGFTREISVKVRSQDPIIFDAGTWGGNNNTHVLYATFTWNEQDDNFVDFANAVQGAEPADAIIFGSVDFDGLGNVTSVSQAFRISGGMNTRITDQDISPSRTLLPKFASSSDIDLNVLNPGANEQLEISLSAAFLASLTGLGKSVAVTGADTTPGYLNDKIVVDPAQGTIKATLNPAADEDLQIILSPTTIKVSGADTTHGNLNDKIGVNTATGLTKTITNPAANEVLSLALSPKTAKVTDNDTTHGNLQTKIISDQLDISVVNPGANEQLKINLSDVILSQTSSRLRWTPKTAFFKGDIAVIAPGTLYGNTSGDALELNGGYAHVGTDPTLDFTHTTSWSVSFWIRCKGTGFETIFAKMDTSNWVGYSLFVQSVTGRLEFKLTTGGGGGTGITVQGSTDMRDGDWHNVVISYDGSTTAAGVDMFVDGVAETTGTLADSVDSSISNAEDFRIGRTSDGLNPFTGTIDDFILYSGTLDLADAVTLYNEGFRSDLTALGTYSSAISYWPMGDGDVPPTLTDVKGSNDLTLNGAIEIITIFPDTTDYTAPLQGFVATQDHTSALQFDTDYVLGLWVPLASTETIRVPVTGGQLGTLVPGHIGKALYERTGNIIEPSRPDLYNDAAFMGILTGSVQVGPQAYIDLQVAGLAVVDNSQFSSATLLRGTALFLSVDGSGGLITDTEPSLDTQVSQPVGFFVRDLGDGTAEIYLNKGAPKVVETGTSTFSFVATAAEDMAIRTVVKVNSSGEVEIADPLSVAGVKGIVGITAAAVTTGNPVQVITYGLMDGTVSAVGDPIYLVPLVTNNVGATYTDAVGAFIVNVGTRVNSTQIFIDIQKPIEITPTDAGVINAFPGFVEMYPSGDATGNTDTASLNAELALSGSRKVIARGDTSFRVNDSGLVVHQYLWGLNPEHRGAELPRFIAGSAQAGTNPIIKIAPATVAGTSVKGIAELRDFSVWGFAGTPPISLIPDLISSPSKGMIIKNAIIRANSSNIISFDLSNANSWAADITEISFEDCLFEHATGTDGNMSFLATDYNIQKLSFKRCRWGIQSTFAPVPTAQLIIDGSGGAGQIQNLEIIDCDFQIDQIVLNDVIRGKIIGNRMIRSTDTTITTDMILMTNCQNIKIHDNHFDAGLLVRGFITMTGVTRCTVIGNYFRSAVSINDAITGDAGSNFNIVIGNVGENVDDKFFDYPGPGGDNENDPNYVFP